MATQRDIPANGTHLTLYTYGGSATPYTVIGYEKGALLVQECALIFNGDRYFDTVADAIVEDPNGYIEKLHFYPSSGKWQRSKYCWAVFGVWEHQPYLD